MKKFKKKLKSLLHFKSEYLSVESRKCILPTRIFVPKYYEYRMGKKMDLRHPKLFSEKLNWMKVYYHDPLFTLCADKYRMRKYVEKILGPGYTVPLLGKWDRAEDIDFASLPDRFVLKANHDGGPIICADKASFDCEAARALLSKKLNTSQYAKGREWSYKNIKRCIIAEDLLGDGTSFLNNYKFFCFYGEPKYLQVESENESAKEFKVDYFDMEFNELPFKSGLQKANNTPKKPGSFEEMKNVAVKLSSYGEGIPLVRVDMYYTGSRIYIGELTFYTGNGMIDYDPPEWDGIIGKWMVLPKKNGWRQQKGRDNAWIKKTLLFD